MSQLNVYVPDDLEAKVRKEAARRGLSVSAFVTELVRKEVSINEWPPGFFELAGSWVGDFPEIEDLPPQERDWSNS
jgi:plasmid stability protein